jgi:hypothetical protein
MGQNIDQSIPNPFDLWADQDGISLEVEGDDGPSFEHNVLSLRIKLLALIRI